MDFGIKTVEGWTGIKGFEYTKCRVHTIIVTWISYHTPRVPSATKRAADV